MSQPSTAAPLVELGLLHIDGVWRETSDGATAPTITPIGRVSDYDDCAGHRKKRQLHSAVRTGLLLQWEDRNTIPLHGADPELIADLYGARSPAHHPINPALDDLGHLHGLRIHP